MRIRRPLAHPLNLGELQAQVSILCLQKGHPLLQRGHLLHDCRQCRRLILRGGSGDGKGCEQNHQEHQPRSLMNRWQQDGLAGSSSGRARRRRRGRAERPKRDREPRLRLLQRDRRRHHRLGNRTRTRICGGSLVCLSFLEPLSVVGRALALASRHLDAALAHHPIARSSFVEVSCRPAGRKLKRLRYS